MLYQPDIREGCCTSPTAVALLRQVTGDTSPYTTMAAMRQHNKQSYNTTVQPITMGTQHFVQMTDCITH